VSLQFFDPHFVALYALKAFLDAIKAALDTIHLDFDASDSSAPTSCAAPAAAARTSFGKRESRANVS
jgi:hypothetical protein